MLSDVRLTEGDVFAIPLEDGGFAVGLIACVDKEGFTFGYFFGPRRKDVPAMDGLGVLDVEAAVYARKFSDYGISAGEWPIIGHLANWNRADCPLPSFCKAPSPGYEHRPYFLVDYSPENLVIAVGRRRVSAESCKNHPKDGISGHAALITVLSGILGEGEVNSVPRQEPVLVNPRPDVFDNDDAIDLITGCRWESPEVFANTIEEAMRKVIDSIGYIELPVMNAGLASAAAVAVRIRPVNNPPASIVRVLDQEELRPTAELKELALQVLARALIEDDNEWLSLWVDSVGRKTVETMVDAYRVVLGYREV